MNSSSIYIKQNPGRLTWLFPHYSSTEFSLLTPHHLLGQFAINGPPTVISFRLVISYSKISSTHTVGPLCWAGLAIAIAAAAVILPVDVFYFIYGLVVNLLQVIFPDFYSFFCDLPNVHLNFINYTL